MQKIYSIAKDITKLNSNKLSLMLYSIITGLITGIVIVLYRISLDKIVEIRNDYLENINLYKLLIIIVLFILGAVFIQKLLNLFPMISGSGIPQVAGLLQKKIRFNYIFELPSKFIAGVIAIGCGLSLGREGPSIHLGSYIGEGVFRNIKKSEIYQKYLVTSGATAGLSAAFNAPLSGVMFAIEELHKFISPILIVCLLLSSATAALIARLFLGNELVFEKFHNVNTLPFTFKTFAFNILLIVILNIFVLFLSFAFNYSLMNMRKLYLKIKVNNYIKIIFVFMVSLIVIYIFPQITGGGHDLFESLFTAKYSLIFLIALLIGKLVFTTFSYSTGASGGIFLPMLVVGGLFGKVFSYILINYFGISEVYANLYMLLAMCSFFTSVVKAPITGIILILEMTGSFSNLFLITITAGISYTFSELFHFVPIYEQLFEMMFSKESNRIQKYEEKLKKEKITYKVPIAADSYIVGKKLKDLPIPKNFLIIGVERKGKDFIPNGNTIFQESDILIIFTDEWTAKNTLHLINDLTKVVRIDINEKKEE